ncbi:MAG TPA: DUF92 domain-containing protein [Gemmatimonadales bacterium]|nr:DUF92 domain-containing protein [Gemmatimonadales bacterium]
MALLAWRARSLSADGALAAWVVGTVVLVGTGWMGGAVLAAFFVSSSVVGRLAPALPQSDAKGERRDAWQVAANGGPAGLGALLGLHDPSLGLWVVTGSLAAAAADTWATSVGARSRVPPRRLLRGPPVPPGTSGGMTSLGTVAAATGAAIVGATAAAAGAAPALVPVATLIGFLGMAADSVLGARWQARYHCPACDTASEWPVHRCGARTVPQGGVAWLDNDGVNLAATALAGALSMGAWLLWSP